MRFALVVIVAPAAGIDMDNAWVGVDRAVLVCFTRRHKHQLSIGRATKANQDPDRRQTIQIGRQVSYDCCRLLQSGYARFQFALAIKPVPDWPEGMLAYRAGMLNPAKKYIRKGVCVQLHELR